MPKGDPLFRLYLQTKLPNPHYIPELQAQTTLVNFTVTERGLEDQLLAVVVNKERPDLEEQRAELVEQQNQFTIKLKQLEDDCAIWRGKARHRHRPLEIPDFGKPSSKKAKEAKTKWLEEKALDDSLGFDEDNDKEVTVTFPEPPPLGFGLLNCKDAHGKTHTVVHSMKEGSPADKCPLVATGQVVVSIGGESMAGRGVQEVVATMHVRTNRPTIATAVSSFSC